MKQYFLRELKAQGLVRVVWKSGAEMTPDLMTKNLPGPLFEKHVSGYVREDEYFVEAKKKLATRERRKLDSRGEATLNSLDANSTFDSEYYRI